MDYIFLMILFGIVSVFTGCVAVATGYLWMLLISAGWLWLVYVAYCFWRENQQLEEDERLDRMPGEPVQQQR